MSTRFRWRAPAPWRLAAVVVFVLAGLLFVTTSLDARGLDLRGSSVTDLDTVVRQQRERADDLQRQVAAVGRQVDALGSKVDDSEVARLQAQVDALRGPAGTEAVEGPSITVTLTDAPKSQYDEVLKEQGEAEAKNLVVHQQDIQAVANALWGGGAEAMTLQKQRVVSTTGIKCVGNTVVLHGVPYAPPYVITAVGDVDAMQRALDTSSYVAGYLSYVDKYDLGYEVSTATESRLPAYGSGGTLRYATVPDTDTDTGTGTD